MPEQQSCVVDSAISCHSIVSDTPMRVVRVLAICDFDYFAELFSAGAANGESYDVTTIKGVKKLAPGQMIAILSDDSEVPLLFDDFDLAVMAINHIRGPTPYEYIRGYLPYYGLPCAQIFLPDGSFSFGGTTKDHWWHS